MIENELKGRIIGKYGTLLNFSEHVGWSSRKTYDVVNGKQEPTAKDIEAICAALQVEVPADMKSLFFKNSPLKVD